MRPLVHAQLERRILVNYRIDPAVLAAVVPAPFRPAVIDGQGVAGICLIRLGRLRPAGFPAASWLRTENAAHRIAVEWDGPDGPVTGVYIPRRDTSSRLTALIGGRAFPGWHHLASFDVSEGGGRYQVRVTSRDGAVTVGVDARLAGQIMPGSVFGSLARAASFFEGAPVGYSATPADGVFDGVELSCAGWDFQPLRADDVASSFFGDVNVFPPGTATLDSAFLMRGLRTTWRALPRLRAGTPRPADMLAGSGSGPGGLR